MSWNLNWSELCIIGLFFTCHFFPCPRVKGRGKGLEVSFGSGSPHSNQPCLLFDGDELSKASFWVLLGLLYNSFWSAWFMQQSFLIGPWSSLYVTQVANSMLPTQFCGVSWSTYNNWQHPEITHLNAANIPPYIAFLICRDKCYFWLKSLFYLSQVKGSSFSPLFNFPQSKILKFFLILK